MVANTELINFFPHSDNYGNLIAIEAPGSVPFAVQRVYYIYNVEKGVRRGFHSHRKLQQALICVHGSVKILVKTPYEEENIELNRPDQALLIGPMVWREMYDFSEDAVLLVLASDHYDISDYIRDYNIYCQEAKEYFREKK